MNPTGRTGRMATGYLQEAADGTSVVSSIGKGIASDVSTGDAMVDSYLDDAWSEVRAAVATDELTVDKQFDMRVRQMVAARRRKIRHSKERYDNQHARTRQHARRLVVTDALAIGVAAASPWLSVKTNLLTATTPAVGAVVALAVAWLLALNDSRKLRVMGSNEAEYSKLVKSSVLTFGLGIVLAYSVHYILATSVLFVMLPVGLLTLILTRFLWRHWLYKRRLNGDLRVQVLVVGTARTVDELMINLRRVPAAGYHVIGVCIQNDSTAQELTLADDNRTRTIAGVPVLGNLGDVAAVAHRFAADTIAVTASSAFGPAAVRRLSWELEESNIELVLAPALTDIAGSRIHTEPVAGLPLLHVDKPTYRGASRVVKKLFDAVGSAVFLAIMSPLLLVTAVAVKVSSPGPVFFRQERVGLNGHRFHMIKFRTMVVDSEARLKALKSAQRDAGNEVLFKMKSDPRITKVGRYLRRFGVDELPQLFNVLKGDMSLVGPRPPLLDEVIRYQDEAKLRLLVKPGITGLWQVSGRSNLSWEDTVRLDSYYVENWSLAADFVILWKTARAVLSSAGAY